MFRTRDFILVLTTIVFLVVAIGATTLLSWGGVKDPSQLRLVEDNLGDYSVTVDTPAGLSRADNVASLKQKIAASTQSISAAAPAIPEEPIVSASSSEELAQAEKAEQRCSVYLPYTQPWPATALSFEVLEGSRVVFSQATVVEAVTASSSPVQPERTIYAQLPIRSTASPAAACIGSDVIGIAQDGSLIRNTEVALYSVFGPDTLIGYALDGFPIYGPTTVATDSCGGVVSAGQYRYHLSPERDTIISCYSATPIRL